MQSLLLDALVILLVGGLAYTGWRRGFGALVILGVGSLAGVVITGSVAWMLDVGRVVGPVAVAGGLVGVLLTAAYLGDIRFHLHRHLGDGEDAPTLHGGLRGRLEQRVRLETAARRAHPLSHDAGLTDASMSAESIAEPMARPFERDRPGDRIDKTLGAIAYGAFATALCWWAGTVLLVSPVTRDLASPARSSVTLSVLHGVAPADGAVAQRLVVVGMLPGLAEPAILARRPDSSILDDREVVDAGAASVQIAATMCGDPITASGWRVGDRTVVTNAHAVAGTRPGEVTVRSMVPAPDLRADGTPRLIIDRYAAAVVAFDPYHDLAVLQVGAELPASMPSLQLAAGAPDDAPVAAASSSFGPPGYSFTPLRIDRTVSFALLDLWGRRARLGEVVVFAGRAEQGQSGSPLLDADGRVTAVLVASDTTHGNVGGYAAPTSSVRDIVAAADGQADGIDTGRCTADVA